MKFFKQIEDNMLAPPALKGSRLKTLYPSSASCRDIDNPTKVHGGCLRATWYRLAGYSESDPSGAYSQYIFAAGKMWEEWIIEQCKLGGFFLMNNLKFSIPEYYLSGEIDIAIKDPDTGEVIIVESKTYSSANYQAKAEYGGIGGRVPMPKHQNVMQAALYLHYFSAPDKGGIKRVLLTYFDRACGGPENNREFWITLRPEGDKTYIHIDTEDVKGVAHSYDMPGITLEGVFQRYEEQINSARDYKDEPPPPDYEHVYSKEKVIRLWNEGEIAKTKYEKWVKKPEANPIGDWQCAYCNYRTLCKQQKEEQGYT